MAGKFERRLQNLLGFDVPGDLFKYIVSMTNREDFEAYMKTLLDITQPSHMQYVNELAEFKFGPAHSVTESRPKNASDAGKKNSKKKGLATNHERKPCNCEATQHELINNCLNCGRIVCAAEGSGPCFFCGELVCTPEEEKLIEANPGKSAKLKQKSKAWHQAVEERNKLLDFDKNSSQRTTVIDDQMDYFHINAAWLTPEEKARARQLEKLLEEKRNQARSTVKITLDFAEREIIEDREELDPFKDEVLGKMVSHVSPKSQDLVKVDPILGGDETTQRVISLFEHVSTHQPNATDSTRFHMGGECRGWTFWQPPDDAGQGAPAVEDGTRTCLSVQQPWASLLVSGVKRHEQRTWSTAYRGRLWIVASASRRPTDCDISQAEHFFRSLGYTGAFPQEYPTGGIVGSVRLADCLPREQYRERFPGGEALDSPFAWICEDAEPVEPLLKTGPADVFLKPKGVENQPKSQPKPRFKTIRQH